MLTKTKGIVVSKLKYSDSSLIVKIFTENFGLKSFIVNSPYKKSAVLKSAYLEPLSILDLDIYLKQNTFLTRIKEAKLIYSPMMETNLFSNKSILLFFNDLILQFLFEDQPYADFFQFSYQYLIDFKMKSEFKFKPLYILLNFLKLSGLSPIINYSKENIIFNIQEGSFSMFVKSTMDIKYPYSEQFAKVLAGTVTDLTKLERNYHLDRLINYCQVHIPSFKEPKSLEILREL